jgi:hypothetical protein
VDVALIPTHELQQVLAAWRRRAEILRQNERAAEARRVEECLQQIETLYASATLDTTKPA